MTYWKNKWLIIFFGLFLRFLEFFIAKSCIYVWYIDTNCLFPAVLYLKRTRQSKLQAGIFHMSYFPCCAILYFVKHPSKRTVSTIKQNKNIENYRSSRRRCSVRKDVHRNFAKFTGKRLCQSLFFNSFL